jgi:hypothetical protein
VVEVDLQDLQVVVAVVVVLENIERLFQVVMQYHL